MFDKLKVFVTFFILVSLKVNIVMLPAYSMKSEFPERAGWSHLVDSVAESR